MPQKLVRTGILRLGPGGEYCLLIGNKVQCASTLVEDLHPFLGFRVRVTVEAIDPNPEEKGLRSLTNEE